MNLQCPHCSLINLLVPTENGEHERRCQNCGCIFRVGAIWIAGNCSEVAERVREKLHQATDRLLDER